MLGGFIVEDEDGDNGRTRCDRSGERRLIGKAQIAAEPEDLIHIM
jgi:hypothetical protein